MTKFTDDTPIAMLTVGQLKEILGIDRILGNLTANQTPTEQVMTVEEVVRLTGYSKATIYKFTSERKIPFHKPEHGGSTFSAKKLSTGCKVNHTRRSNNTVITKLNTKQSKL